MSTEWQDLPNRYDVYTAQADNWEIQSHGGSGFWIPWNGDSWNVEWYFRGRPKQPKTKTVKLVAYIMANGIFRWVEEGSMAHKDVVATKLRRAPSEDKTVKVEQ